FRTFDGRLANRGTLVALLEDAFRRRTTAEWLARLRGRVPVAPVYTGDEALADEQVAARGVIGDVPHPGFGTLREVGRPIQIAGVAPRYVPGAALGADTASLLAEVGVDPGELAMLRASGVI